VGDGGRPALPIGGSDDRGLIYGLLEVAECVPWNADPGDPFREVRDAAVRPAAPERALYTMDRAYWESRIRDEAYWDCQLDVLARNRFNSLTIIFGY